jgi:DNA-directed RNA polymerase specialized sigma24 family protein
MSVTLSLSDKRNQRKFTNRIWLNNVDPDGRRVDSRFIEAGYRKEEAFFRYRRDELKDDAVVANLIEEAVYRASRARKKEPLDNLDAYLFTVFTNLADREIARTSQAVDIEPEMLQNLHGAGSEPARHIINRIEIERLLGAMDPTLRWAIEMRTLGYEVQEIAGMIDISPDCLSTRIRRGLKILKRLLSDDSR